MDWWTILGTIASVVGLAVSLYVLSVAKDARAAAREARVLASKRSLSEELQHATKYTEEVGTLLRGKEWTAVRIRAQEIMSSCRQSLTRWPSGLSEQRRDSVLTASTLVRSIADMASDPNANAFGNTKLKRLSDTQLKATELLSDALGEAKNLAENEGE